MGDIVENFPTYKNASTLSSNVYLQNRLKINLLLPQNTPCTRKRGVGFHSSKPLISKPYISAYFGKVRRAWEHTLQADGSDDEFFLPTLVSVYYTLTFYRVLRLEVILMGDPIS